MKRLTEKEIEFLQHSNYIENEQGKRALEDAKKAWRFAKENKNNFSLEYILEIHHQLLRRLNGKIAGKLRDCIIRIGAKREIAYYSKEEDLILYRYFGGKKIPKPEEGELIKKINNWIENYNSKKEKINYEEIKNFHIDFENLHPFRDGNGRTGRILMNIQMISSNLPLLIIHQGEEQQEYYKWFKTK